MAVVHAVTECLAAAVARVAARVEGEARRLAALAKEVMGLAAVMAAATRAVVARDEVARAEVEWAAAVKARPRAGPLVHPFH